MISSLLRTACLALLGLLLSPVCFGDEFRFSPVNQYGMTLTSEYWGPIINYVSERSGVKLTLKIGRTATDTMAYVADHEVEFIFSNHFFSPEREQLGWKVFARRNVPPVYGQIIVPMDSPIRTLEDLENQEVGFTGPEGMIAYKFPYAHLVAKGIEVKVAFTPNLETLMAQLVSGKVRAAAVNSQLADVYARREHRRFRVLWSSEPLYDLALMASPRVPEKTLKAVSHAFLSMHRDTRGREIIKAASEAVGLAEDAYFIPSNGSEYAAYRRFYQTAPPQLR